MNERTYRILFAISILPLLALCYFTGGASSPFRFAYPPLLILISLRLPPNSTFITGLAFSFGYAAMVAVSKPADSYGIILPAAEFFFYLLTACSASAVARKIAKEISQFRITEKTFQGLSSELSTRSMNLQANLDTLSIVHTKLQNLDRNKTVFLGNIAHELRTPLSGIRSYSEILLNYEDLDLPTQREFLEIIQNESVRLTTLVNDILNLIKLESGNVELVFSRVNASELIEECIKLMKPMAEAKNLTLDARIPPDSINLKADSGQVMQILINLINNAIKFTQHGGITVGVAIQDHFAEFSVTDTGEGIFPSEQEKIFDEFYRVLDNVPNRPAGTGLGLAICKKIVDIHEGSIGVESLIGKGSTFRFTIPLFEEETHSQVSESENMRLNQPRRFAPILVVMSGTVNRMCMRKSLENIGYKTFGAASYEKACALAKSTPVDIIIAEINSKMDGIEPLISLASAQGIPFYMSHFHPEPPELISMVINGYIWPPLERHQLLTIFEPIKMQRKKISIISPDMEESRMLQMLLGIEGYTTSLSGHDDNFIDACLSFAPEAIIIGSFKQEQIDGVIKVIKSSANISNLPLILILKEKPPRSIKLVTVPLHGDKPLLFGLSPLVQKIEGELFK